jgi:hypothetical protein
LIINFTFQRIKSIIELQISMDRMLRGPQKGSGRGSKDTIVCLQQESYPVPILMEKLSSFSEELKVHSRYFDLAFLNGMRSGFCGDQKLRCKFCTV